ncbi:hypothetical protein BD324DRAFT_452149 [Kockovaella imperatae]|uniref:Gag1-like clamp domain-containing protein n=1 Tax=Kockovaella imperatae TaxID=4999 RepID=A0A1Y1UHK5_9TREE|nr:hypothetical protein BD324DRAFT_452149 [Kockovaella imperatae]ORX36565.1 hypothetical protein BD324DRAFT_452149 [Kockovaella imperatae]
MTSAQVEKQSSKTKKPKADAQMTNIPSYGVDFFEHRRKLWLAGKAYPQPTSSELPLTYTVTAMDPQPKSFVKSISRETPSIQRLDRLLQNERAIGDKSTWDNGVSRVWSMLDCGRHLSTPIPLNLVIKVLRCSWVRDGTWTIDPVTKRPAVPPESPPLPSDIVPIPQLDPLLKSKHKGQLRLSSPTKWKNGPVIDEEGSEMVSSGK